MVFVEMGIVWEDEGVDVEIYVVLDFVVDFVGVVDECIGVVWVCLVDVVLDVGFDVIVGGCFMEFVLLKYICRCWVLSVFFDFLVVFCIEVIY